jgi:dTDP-4-amino-4,6-dideoxygalactose transaminase
VGTLGDAAAFGFYPNKQMTAGEGGMIVTRHREWDTLFRSLRNQGRDACDSWLTHTRLGYNYRLDELSAALGTAQLRRIDELLAKRARVASWYSERLSRQEQLETPSVLPTTTRMSWFVYVVRLSREVDRGALMAALEKRGVPTRLYFSPIHLQPFYIERFGYRRGDFPVAEELGDTSLALPFSASMTEEEVGYVCDQLVACIEGQSRRSRVAVSGETIESHSGEPPVTAV